MIKPGQNSGVELLEMVAPFKNNSTLVAGRITHVPAIWM
jgi:hypothetical protein